MHTHNDSAFRKCSKDNANCRFEKRLILDIYIITSMYTLYIISSKTVICSQIGEIYMIYVF